MQMTVGTNTPETLSAIFAIGAFVAAASLTMRIIWESVVFADARCFAAQEADWFTVAASSIAHGLIDRNALAGEGGFIDGAGTFQDDAVYEDILTGAHDKHIAAADLGNGHGDLLTVPHKHGGFRREVHSQTL